MCDCIKQMNQELDKHNETLDLNISLVGKPTSVIISTYRIDKPAKSGIRLQATYCPFCGEKYDTESESQS